MVSPAAQYVLSLCRRLPAGSTKKLRIDGWQLPRYKQRGLLPNQRSIVHTYPKVRDKP
jgi:hypothetical protein